MEILVMIVLSFFFILLLIYTIFDVKLDLTEDGDLIAWYGRKERKFIYLIKNNDLW